jgi:hypothetical protein
MRVLLFLECEITEYRNSEGKYLCTTSNRLKRQFVLLGSKLAHSCSTLILMPRNIYCLTPVALGPFPLIYKVIGINTFATVFPVALL